MKFTKIILQVILVLTVQSTLVRFVEISGVLPDLIMVLLVHIALKQGAVVGVFAGFFMGLVEDIYGPLEYMGAAALSKSFIGYFIGQLDETFLKLDYVTKVVLLGVAFFATDFIYALAIRMEPAVISHHFISQTLPQGMYTLLLGALFYWFLHSPRDRYAT